MNDRYITYLNMAIIFLVTVVLQGGALAKTLTAESLTIPCKQEGLFVDAICGIGCESLSQSCNVYILTEKEYQNYKLKFVENNHAAILSSTDTRELSSVLRDSGQTKLKSFSVEAFAINRRTSEKAK